MTTGETSMDPVATTALYTAVLRARESAHPDRLFDDPYAAALAGPEGPDLVASMEAGAPGATGNPVIPVRTRFFDDTLERLTGPPADGAPALRQVVVLAAGFDTRAFRLALPPELTVFELDRPEVLDLKATRLAALGAVPRCRRVGVPVDLAGDWPPVLQAAGFDPQRPAAWLVEGLTPYLTDAGVQHLLGTLSGLAAPGSRLVVDVFGRAFLTSPAMDRFRAVMAARGSPFRFGTDDPGALLTAHGWRAEVTRFGDPAANFGRWTPPEGYPDDSHAPQGYLIAAQR